MDKASRKFKAFNCVLKVKLLEYFLSRMIVSYSFLGQPKAIAQWFEVLCNTI